MKILIVNNESLDIVSKYDADEPSQSNYGGPWGDPNQFSHIACPEELDSECVQAARDENDNIIIQIDEDKASAKLSAARESKLDQIRALRVPKLARVDQLVNVAVLTDYSAGDKLALKNYRDALLNITESYKTNMASLDTVVVADIEWPVEP
jgi:hypothetical protein